MTRRRGIGKSALAHAALLTIVCAAAFLPRLGWSGLSTTEGHRAIPGWTMLDSGEFFRLEMFGVPYLRKPPGMPWAIAASSAIFGETEFAARFVSVFCAWLMSLGALWAGNRWFGRPWGLAAGLVQALLPWTLPMVRSAEIEMLNQLFTQASSLLAAEFLLGGRAAGSPGVARTLVRGAAFGAMLLGMLLAKGPAGAPIVGAVVVAACIVRGSARPLANPVIWIGLALSAGAAALLLRPIWAMKGHPDAVHEDVQKFFWDPGRLWQIAALIPAAIVASLPASLALALPWGRAARDESSAWAGSDAAEPHPACDIARTLAWAWVISMVVYAALGIGNVRYALPASVLLPPLAAYAAMGWLSTDRPFGPHRRWAAGRLMLGNAAAWPVVLVLIAAVWIPVSERNRAAQSGREAGLELAAHIPKGARVWARDLIEARPEVLWYASRGRGASGRPVRPAGEVTVLWKWPELERGEVPPPGTYLVLRADTPQSEGPGRYADAIASGRMTALHTGRFNPDAARTRFKVTFTLYRVEQ